MWQVTAQNITMTEGDFGVALPVTISGTDFSEGDSVKITIKDKANGTTKLEKTFSDIQNNTVNLELTESESELFPPGAYIYTLDWYKESVFMCNIIREALFKVVDKA